MISKLAAHQDADQSLFQLWLLIRLASLSGLRLSYNQPGRFILTRVDFIFYCLWLWQVPTAVVGCLLWQLFPVM